ncbi:MAG: zinc ABC transporter solute-binding protein [Anaerolineales bacterium]|nr:zinc ABC transporter solute-binding protein [Anaerolineales bacterium]
MRALKKFMVIAGLTALLIGLFGCGAAQPAAPAPTDTPVPPTTAAEQVEPAVPTTGSEKLKVIATYSILGDLAQNVGGDTIELRTLVGPGGDAHTFEPTPADGVALAEASLVFENGLEFETWLNDLYTASASKAVRVVVTEQIEPIKMAEGGHEHEEHAEHEEHGEHAAEAEHEEHEEHATEAEHEEHGEHAAEAEHEEHEEHAAEAEHEEHAEGDAHGHHHGEFDPHVWHDVSNVMRMVEAIRDGLVKADPAHAQTYQANAETYLAQLKELDAWVRQEVETLPAERRKLVTSHDTFSYFARAYGFDVVGSALPVSTEAADPSAKEIVELVERIKAVGVPAIFAENVANPDLMERIASEAGVVVAPTLYTDAVGEPGSEGDTYLKMIRYNVTTMVTALKS